MRFRASDPDAAFGVHRRASNAVAGVASVLALVFASALGWVLVTGPGAEWAPLGPYPVQDVEGTGSFSVDGRSFPSVKVSDDAVVVTGTKCVRESVSVSGTVSWASVDPLGLTLQVGQGTRDRQAGCVTSEFVNPLPPEVKVWAQLAFDRGRRFVVVQIVGVEQATEGDRTSEQRTWRTEQFVILPGGS